MIPLSYSARRQVPLPTAIDRKRAVVADPDQARSGHSVQLNRKTNYRVGKRCHTS
jgi:hypothetical protein